MALATRCPHCNTTFRVAADQLKLRGGIVRCGACDEVFDGNATLVEPQPGSPREDAAQTPAPTATASSAFDAEVAAIEAQAAAAAEPAYTLDFDTTFDPFGILPKAALPEAAPEPQAGPEPEPEPEPALPAGLVVDEEIEALAPPDAPSVAAPVPSPAPYPMLPMRESAPVAPPDFNSAPLTHTQPASARSKPARHKGARPKAYPLAVTLAKAPERAPDPDEPEFVRQGRVQEQTGKTRRVLMLAGSVVLALALLVQGMTTFRNVLAARYPGLKPALAVTCAVFGCRVELPAQIDTLSIETGELQTQGPDTFVFTTLLRNQGALAQAWPHIELALTDALEKPLVRRVFTPAQYLQGAGPVAKGFAPRSEQAIKLHFESSQLKASGYRIAIFYP